MYSNPNANQQPPMMMAPMSQPAGVYPPPAQAYDPTYGAPPAQAYDPMYAPPPPAPMMYNDPAPVMVAPTSVMGPVAMNNPSLKVLHQFNPVHVTCNSCNETAITRIKTNVSPGQWIFCCMFSITGF